LQTFNTSEGGTTRLRSIELAVFGGEDATKQRLNGEGLKEIE